MRRIVPPAAFQRWPEAGCRTETHNYTDAIPETESGNRYALDHRCGATGLPGEEQILENESLDDGQQAAGGVSG